MVMFVSTNHFDNLVMDKVNEEVWLKGNNIGKEAQEKRKRINFKIFKFGCLPIFLLLIFLIFSGKSKKEPIVQTDKVLSKSKANIDFNSFNYILPNSNYEYKIEITDIKTKLIKDAFEVKDDEYSIPKKVDGYQLMISYTMTNPYDKVMMASVPDYYYITSTKDEKFTYSTTYSKSCFCDINNSAEITDSNGKELWEISKGKCGYDDYCVEFKPKESREFRVRFTDPIITTAKSIVFSGFDLKWKNPEYNKERDRGLVIDLTSKKIVGEKKF
jgi:uncharacterized protein YxjI